MPSSRSCEPPRAQPRSEHIGGFYKFLDNNDTSFKERSTRLSNYRKFESTTNSLNAQTMKGAVLRGPPPKHVLGLEQSQMFGYTAYDVEKASEALQEQRRERHRRLINLGQSDVLFSGEEKRKYFRKRSTNGCPQMKQNTRERLFGETFGDKPKTQIQLDHALVRKIELRNHDSRGRTKNPITGLITLITLYFNPVSLP